MSKQLRRPGRPRREDDRKVLSTFLPSEMKLLLKEAAQKEAIPFSDWVMKHVPGFLTKVRKNNLSILRTHPRSRNWPNQNIKFSLETADQLQALSKEKDVSVSALLLALLTKISDELNEGKIMCEKGEL